MELTITEGNKQERQDHFFYWVTLPVLIDTGHPNEDDKIALLLNLGRLTQIFFPYCDPTAGVAHITQLCQFRLTDMSWVGHSDTAVFTCIGSLDLLWVTEMALLCSNHPAGFTLVDS